MNQVSTTLYGVDDVAKAMMDAAGAGKTVVRLKCGDPVLFARAAEALGALRDAVVATESTSDGIVDAIRYARSPRG